MAIRLIDQYPNRAGTPNADYPHGVPKNRSAPGAVDGTPFEQAWFRDKEGFMQSLLETAGITPSGIPDKVGASDYMDALVQIISQKSQFSDYSSLRTYVTGEITRGSDGQFYEFYDRDQAGAVQGVDPTNAANRPHIWMEWDGVKPGSTIEWRSETLPEGYIENDGAEISRNDYRRVFAVHGTTYGAGDGSTTFLLPDDRGEFKRGLDHGRGVDSGRLIGEHQLDQMQRMTGRFGHAFGDNAGTDRSQGAFSHQDGMNSPRGTQGSVGTSAVDTYFDSANSPDARTSSTTTGETRPRNNAVIYLTKI